MKKQGIAKTNIPFGFFLLVLFAVILGTGVDRVGYHRESFLGEFQQKLSEPPRALSDSYEILNSTTSDRLVENQNVSHIPMPSVLRGIYLTGWMAGTERGIARLLELADDTTINAVIIDIKDATGRLSYQPKDPMLIETGVGSNRIKNLPVLFERLHGHGIYVIGRIAVFQDPFFAQRMPTEAFQDTRTGALWRDYKGITWLHPYSQSVWEYTARIAEDAFEQGFDEINLDYVRFPSDGPLTFLDQSLQTQTRALTIESFFSFIGPRLRNQGIPLSADLFGLTMSAKDDLGIGQELERIAPHVDVVAPMVYPSHFAKGAYGIEHPAHEPGAIINRSLTEGARRLEAIGIDRTVIRPWFQDFDLGAVYTADLVREQIHAAEALGISSWALWDPRNEYTKEAIPTE